jgi:ABC-type Na+ efflux pump permease subunit
MVFMNTGKNKKIEEILSSLDGAKRAEAPDFFYSRLKAKILVRHEGVESTRERSWILRPVFIVSAIFLVLAINVFVFLKGREESTINTIVDNNESFQQSIAAEYSLNDNNTVYDLNQDK